MNLNNIREGELKDVFDALEEAFEQSGADYYIIGAMAKDIWYSRGEKIMRQTKDVDFAIQVGSQEEYMAIRKYLKEKKGFADYKGNEFVMLTPGGVQVDILPFGGVEIDGSVTLAGEGLSNISVTGFTEVYQSGTQEVVMETGHRFKTATLPAIILLKLIAFDDRPEKRTKDPGDIAGIVTHFFDLQADLIYEKHSDLFLDENDDRSLPEIAAIVIGREIKKIADDSDKLIDRLKQILESHIQQKEDSSFIRHMVAEIKGTAEEGLRILELMLIGIQ